jgi:hypothetical protein
MDIDTGMTQSLIHHFVFARKSFLTTQISKLFLQSLKLEYLQVSCVNSQEKRMSFEGDSLVHKMSTHLHNSPLLETPWEIPGKLLNIMLTEACDSCSTSNFDCKASK